MAVSAGQTGLLHLGTFGEDRCPGDGAGKLAAIVVAYELFVRRPPQIMRLARKQLRLNTPLRGDEIVIVIAQRIAILNDAANLDIGHRKHLRHILHGLALLDQLVVGLPRQRNHGAVGMNGATGHIVDGVPSTALLIRIFNFDVAELLTLLGQHLQPNVDAEFVQMVVRRLFTIEVHRRRAWNLRLRGHGELLFCGLNPFLSVGSGHSKREQQRQHYGTAEAEALNTVH